MFGLRYLPDVVTLELNEERCSGCGVCLEVCPHPVFELRNGKARIVCRDACMECGACALNCPVHALTVRAGVGCATAIITSALRGTETTCDWDCCGGPTDSAPA